MAKSWLRRSGPVGRTSAVIVALSLAALLTSCGSADDRTGVSLILKTQTNPYFVSMKDADQKQADKVDARLSVATGNADGDTQTQINAIDTAIARGDKGVAISSNGPAVKAALRRAKDLRSQNGQQVPGANSDLADLADKGIACQDTPLVLERPG